MVINLGFFRLLPQLVDVNSIKDLLKISYELYRQVDLSYKIFSLEIYLPISPMGCIASQPQPLDSETLKCANPSAPESTKFVSQDSYCRSRANIVW